MKARNDNGWRRGELEIIGRDGQHYRVFGSVCGRFGIFDRTVKSDGVTRRVTYLTRIATCQVLAPFATRRDARLAAQVIADLAADGDDNDAVTGRWQRAGFYVSTYDDAGNWIWKLLGGQLTARYAWGALASEGQVQWLH